MEEPEVFTRNYQPPLPPKQRIIEWLYKSKQKTAPYIQKIKSPKFLTIIALLLILTLLATAATLVSKTKKAPEEAAPPIITVQSPNPTPAVGTMTQKVIDFENKLEKQESFQQKLTKPIVDLDLNFEMR